MTIVLVPLLPLQNTKHLHTCPFDCDIKRECWPLSANTTQTLTRKKNQSYKRLKEIDCTEQLWYNHTPRNMDAFSLPSELNDIPIFPKTIGDIGIIPKQVNKLAEKKHGLKKGKALILKLQIAIVRRSKNIWYKRCKKHHETLALLKAKKKTTKNQKSKRKKTTRTHPILRHLQW